jgi:hypothetical protein
MNLFIKPCRFTSLAMEAAFFYNLCTQSQFPIRIRSSAFILSIFGQSYETLSEMRSNKPPACQFLHQLRDLAAR